MNRTEFIRQCSFVCLGAFSVASILPGCVAGNIIDAPILDNRMQVPLTSFESSTKNKVPQYKSYIVVNNETLNYPIVIYRNGEGDYTALLLRCSHQYNELNVNGELLTCPAHGSEFDRLGNVVNGPASDKLRSFKVTTDNKNLYIQLA